MQLTSSFKDNAKLAACANFDADHISEQNSPSGPHVVLIKKALNIWASNNSVNTIAITSNYNGETSALVIAFKKSHGNELLNYKKEIDPIVGKKTVAALDKILAEKENQDNKKKDDQKITSLDLIIYISGKLDSLGLGGSELKRGMSAEFDDVLNIQSRKDVGLMIKGFGGSLENSASTREAVDLVKSVSNRRSDQRIIIYGYSAGAKQALEACSKIETENEGAGGVNFLGLFRKVDLVITIDAAAGFGHVDRRVAGCVRRNVNFFQTSSSLGGSHGGPNRASFGMEKIMPIVDNRNFDNRLPAVDRTSRHTEINNVCHPLALREIRKTLSSLS